MNNTYNPLTSDIENNNHNEEINENDKKDSFFNMPLNHNFVRDLILYTLIPNIDSNNYIEFKKNSDSHFHRIHIFIVMLFQFVLSSYYSNIKDNILFLIININASLNLIWFLLSFGVISSTNELENEIEILKQVELGKFEINDIVPTHRNCNKLIVKIFKFWLILIVIRFVELISFIISFCGFNNLLSYLFSNTNMNQLQIALASLSICYQLFIIDSVTFKKLKIY